MEIVPWKLQSEELIHEKYGRKLVKRHYEMPDGTIADFYIKDEKDAACILALTPENMVILVEQFRPGPGKVLRELPGGIMDGLDPIETITKELVEETGYVGDITLVGTCAEEGYTAREKHCFIARNCKKVSEQSLEETEFLKVVVMSLGDFRSHLRGGQLTDVEGAYLALDYLGLL